MGFNLGELFARIGLDTSSFEAGVAKVKVGIGNMEKQAREGFKNMEQGADSAATKIKKLGGGFAALGAALGGLAFVAVIKDCIDAGLALEKLDTQFKAVFQSASTGAREFAYVREQSSRLGLDLKSSAEAYAKFAASTRNTSIEGQKTREVFTSVSEAVSAMKLSTDEANGIFLALSQMMSKGKVSAEEMNGQLGERLPGALKLAADAMRISTHELMDQMQQGKIMASELLPKLAAQIHATYGEAAVEAANSGQAELNRFNNALFDTKASVGQALIPAMNNILEALAPVIEGVKTAIKWFMQLSTAWAVTLDKAAAIKEAGLRGILTSEGRKELGRQLNIIDEAGLQTFMETERKFDPGSSKVSQAEIEAEKLRNQLRLKQETGGNKPTKIKKAKDDTSEYDNAIVALDKALREAKASIADSGLDELAQALANVDRKAQDLTEQYGKLIVKHPDLKAKIKEVQAAEEAAAKEEYLNKHFKELKDSIAELDREYATIQDRMAGGDLFAAVQSQFRKIDADTAEFLANAKKLGKGDEAIKLVGKQKVKSALNIVTEAYASIKEQITEGQKQISNAMRLNDIDGATGFGFFDANERDAQRAAQSIRDSFEKPIASLEKLIGIVPEAKGMLEELKAEMEGLANANYELVKDAPIQAAKQRIQSLLDVTQNISDALGAMQQPLQDFLVTFAQTGEFDFSNLIQGLVKQLQVMAAAKTAQLLMEAMFAEIMVLVSTAMEDGRAGQWQAAAAEAEMGALIMGSFVLGSGLAGMAHSGIDSIPQDGTWLLKKNERVVDSKTNKDLKQFMKSGSRPNVNMNVTINGGDEEGIMNALPKLRDMILDVVNNDIASGGRTGSVIKTYAR